MAIAVIDMGTNMFNLLIAEKGKHGLLKLAQQKISVKLGTGGIHNNVIMESAIKRAEDAILKHKETIGKFEVHKIIAIGTSALRTASNANDVSALVEKELGISVDIISGEQEATYIYLGIKQSIENIEAPALILDIGGGSNEFILVSNSQMRWKQSYQLGMARLVEKFTISDPILEEEITALHQYFERELTSLFAALEHVDIVTLVGAEGAFETFYNIIGFATEHEFAPLDGKSLATIEEGDFRKLYNHLAFSTKAERKKMKGLELHRLEMIVPAIIFVKYVVDKLGIKDLAVSPNSLKEGVAWIELYNGNNN